MDIRKVIWISLAIIILFGIGYRLYSLQQKSIDQSLTAINKTDSTEKTKLSEDAALFSELLKTGLIVPMADGLRLKLAPSDFILIEKAAKAKNSAYETFPPKEIKKRERLLETLYHSFAGFAVQSQVRLWNETHYFAAVRDDRPRATVHRENQWRAFDANRSQLNIRSGKLVPEYFGFVNNGRLRPYFSDWLTALTDSAEVEFRTRIQLDKAARFNVQLIGKPIKIYPAVKPAPRCLEPEDCSSDDARAFSLSFFLPAGNHELRITALPVLNNETHIPGLNIRLARNKEKFEWIGLALKTSAVDNQFKIMASDGTMLSDESGTPSTYSEQNGLLPLVGFSHQATFSLTGIMARSFLQSGKSSCYLTIDPKIQTVAQETLRQRIASLWPSDDYADERRGAVVILNAGTGAVLAAAGIPVPPPGTHPWDLASFAKTYPLRNPLSVRSWQSLDKHTTPGSTFKPVVALSAIKVSGEEKSVDHFISGWPKKKFRKKRNRTGLNLNCAVYQPLTGDCYSATLIPRNTTQTISNFGRQPLWRVFNNNKIPATCPETTKSKRSVLGLREAVRDSVNIWFARLAYMVDGNRARQFDEAVKARKKGESMPNFPAFHLVKTAEQLGFGETPLDLAINMPRAIQLSRRQYMAEVHEGDVLYANPGKLNLMDPNQRGLQWILAQNAIGQGMTASPLQMARVAAAIAGGKIIHPYLFHQYNDEMLKPPETVDLNIKQKKLTLLRQGMKAVVEAGTARRAFKNHPDVCRIYGKTGTANVGVFDKKKVRVQRRFYTAWFIGWREPEKEGERRLAFACMVSHVHGKYNTGGKVCAPIMAEILKKLD